MKTDLKRRLDSVFSRWIRERDTPGACISCGRHITFSDSDAGHYIPRAHLVTRWDERNVNAQCVECNRYRGGNMAGYRRGLDAKYGPGTADYLQELKHKTVKFTRGDYTEMLKKYNCKPQKNEDHSFLFRR